MAQNKKFSANDKAIRVHAKFHFYRKLQAAFHARTSIVLPGGRKGIPSKALVADALAKFHATEERLGMKFRGEKGAKAVLGIK